MTYSIYHFFAHLIRNKALLVSAEKLEDDFPFDTELLSCKNSGKFPDLAIRVNSTGDPLYTGGELVEIKESKAYKISSFNSTIPTGKKDIQSIVSGESNVIREQMLAHGDDIDSLPIRDVFYLVRGRHKHDTKICLIHGSFFETIPVQDLISGSFEQVLEERLEATGLDISDELRQTLLTIFSEQSSFSRTRDVDKASVKLRFRVMTEIKAQGNILSSTQYPHIGDNTLNLLLPCDSDANEEQIKLRTRTAMSTVEYNALKVFRIKHLFNGDFLVFQISLLT